MAQPTPIWIGTVDADGKLHLAARGLFDAYLRRLKNAPVQLVIKKQARPKSRNQTGYLFAAIYPVLAEHFGYRDYEVSEVHDAVMRELRGLKPEPNPLKLRVSLSDMSHEEVSAYIESVRHWALMVHGCVTPDADKVEHG